MSWIGYTDANPAVKEGNIGITTKKGKSIELTHKTSGKEIVVVNSPSVLKKYKKLGFLISMPEGKLTEKVDTLPPFEIAKRILKHPLWKSHHSWAKEVIKKFRGRGVTPKAVDKWLPYYIDGKEISALFEGKLKEFQSFSNRTINSDTIRIKDKKEYQKILKYLEKTKWLHMDLGYSGEKYGYLIQFDNTRDTMKIRAILQKKGFKLIDPNNEGKLTEAKKMKYKKNDWKKINKIAKKKDVMIQSAFGDEFKWEEGSRHGVFASESDGREIELNHDDIDIVVVEGKLTETKFYAFWNRKKYTIDGKSLWDAKQKAIIQLKVPKSKVGLLSIVNAGEHEKGGFRFEGKLTELTKFTPVQVKQLQKAFKNVKGILPDTNPVVQKLNKMLMSVDRKNLEMIANAGINILSPIAKKRLGMKEGKLIEGVFGKFDTGINFRGNGLTVYDRNQSKGGDFKSIAFIVNGKVKLYDKDVKKEPKLMKVLQNIAKSQLQVEGKLTEKPLKKNPNIWVSDKFDKVIDKLPFAKLTKNNIIKLAKKFKIDKDDALRWVSYNQDVDFGLKEGKLTEGGAWTTSQTKSVDKIDGAFKKLLAKKGIEPYSYEASKLWKRAGFDKKMRDIFGKDESIGEGKLTEAKKPVSFKLGGVTFGKDYQGLKSRNGGIRYYYQKGTGSKNMESDFGKFIVKVGGLVSSSDKNKVAKKLKEGKITEKKETPVEVARRIVQNGQYEKYKGMMLDTFTASAIVKVYDAVNDANKKKLDSLKLPKLVKLVWKVMKK